MDSLVLDATTVRAVSQPESVVSERWNFDDKKSDLKSPTFANRWCSLPILLGALFVLVVAVFLVGVSLMALAGEHSPIPFVAAKARQISADKALIRSNEYGEYASNESPEEINRAEHSLLPGNVKPTLYKLSIQAFYPHPSVQISEKENLTYDGSLTLHLDCLEDTNSVILHSKSLNISFDSISLREDSAATELQLDSLDYKPKLNQVVLSFEQTLRAGFKYTLTMEWVITSHSGTYMMFPKKDLGSWWIVLSHFGYTHAKSAFPCFEQPGFGAPFEFTVTHPKGTNVVSNTAVSGEPRPYRSGWVQSTFERSPSMWPNSLAFVIGEFEMVEKELRPGVKIRFWGRPAVLKLKAQVVDFVFNLIIKSISWLEEYLSSQFPFRYYNFVALPKDDFRRFEGHLGFLWVPESWLFENRTGHILIEHAYVVWIVHEVAESWFGQLIPCKSWSDIWLHEGLAAAVELKAFNHAIGSERSDEDPRQSRDMIATQAMADDEARYAHAAKNVNFFGGDQFRKVRWDTLIRKPVAVLNMVKQLVGETNVKMAFRMYIRRFQHKSAGHNDFWGTFDEVISGDKSVNSDWNGGQLNVTSFADNWLTQKGYPVLVMGRSGAGELSVTQRYFNTDLNMTAVTISDDNDPTASWRIPLGFQKEGEERTLLTWCTNTARQGCHLGNINKDQWLLLNPNFDGYYRTLHTAENYHNLARQLMHDHTMFSERSRYMLLENAFYFMNKEVISVESAYGLTKYLSMETELLPIDIAARRLITHRIRLINSGGHYDFAWKYGERLLGHLVENRNIWDEVLQLKPNEFHKRKHLFNLVNYVCHLNQNGCLAEGLRRFSKVLADCTAAGQTLHQACNPYISFARTRLYCLAIARGTQSDWTNIWQLYLHERNTSRWSDFEHELRVELGSCTKSGWSLKQMLITSLTNHTGTYRPFSKSEAGWLLYYTLSNSRLANTVWDFMKENWGLVQTGYRSWYHQNAYPMLAKYFYHENDINELEAFRKNNNVSRLFDMSFDRGIAVIRKNIEWKQRVGTQLEAWLENNYLD